MRTLVFCGRTLALRIVPKGDRHAVRITSGGCPTRFLVGTGGIEPGFYGWALVLDWHEDERGMYFRPVAPSDHLKMHPWWDDAAKDIADKVRGKVKQGTLWEVPEDLAADISAGITAWLNRSAERVTAPSQRQNA